MNRTDNRMQTHWNEAREFIKKTWPLFTDVQLNRINGDYDLFAKYLNDFYGGFPATEARTRARLKKLFDELDEKQSPPQ